MLDRKQEMYLLKFEKLKKYNNYSYKSNNNNYKAKILTKLWR